MEQTSTESGWKLYGIWWAMSFVRQMHNRIQEEKDRRIKVEADLVEWQNKTLALVNLRPLHHQPGPVPTPMFRAPVGPTQKANMLRAQAIEKDNIGKPTDKDILDAANKVAGNQGADMKALSIATGVEWFKDAFGHV